MRNIGDNFIEKCFQGPPSISLMVLSNHSKLKTCKMDTTLLLREFEVFSVQKKSISPLDIQSVFFIMKTLFNTIWYTLVSSKKEGTGIVSRRTSTSNHPLMQCTRVYCTVLVYIPPRATICL